MPTVPLLLPRYHELRTYSAIAPVTRARRTTIASRPPNIQRLRYVRLASEEPSSRTSTTTTVTLSCPPPASAADTRLSAAVWGSTHETAMSSISESSTMEESPSEQMMMRSPVVTSSVKWSAYMSGSLPSALVMMERDGWTLASSAVISPASTSSSTYEWSCVRRTSAPAWRR